MLMDTYYFCMFNLLEIEFPFSIEIYLKSRVLYLQCFKICWMLALFFSLIQGFYVFSIPTPDYNILLRLIILKSTFDFQSEIYNFRFIIFSIKSFLSVKWRLRNVITWEISLTRFLMKTDFFISLVYKNKISYCYKLFSGYSRILVKIIWRMRAL